MLRLYLTTMRTCCAAIASVVSCINCVCRLLNCSSPLHIAQRRLLPRLFHSDVSALCIVGVYGEAKERESEKRCEREGRRRFASFWVVRELMNIRNDATMTMVQRMRGWKWYSQLRERRILTQRFEVHCCYVWILPSPLSSAELELSFAASTVLEVRVYPTGWLLVLMWEFPSLLCSLLHCKEKRRNECWVRN